MDTLKEMSTHKINKCDEPSFGNQQKIPEVNIFFNFKPWCWDLAGKQSEVNYLNYYPNSSLPMLFWPQAVHFSIIILCCLHDYWYTWILDSLEWHSTPYTYAIYIGIEKHVSHVNVNYYLSLF